MAEEKPNKKTKEEILFPEAKVDKYAIKPWSFGVLFEISEMLERVLSKMDEKGLSIDNIFTQDGVLSWSILAKIFTLASDEVIKIISLTVDIDESEIKGLDMQTGIKIAFVIFKQNKEVIKNALSSLS